jgi:hypothetical protein
MPRVNLPEVEDQPWCPAWLRDAMTGYLQVVIGLTRPYDVAIPAISELLDQTASDRIVDLASGAGGPWPQLLPALRESRPSLRVTLTDLNPHDQSRHGLGSCDGLRYLPESLSADDAPKELGGVRTMFTALHHLEPERVRSVLSAAQRDRVGFAAFEATHRSGRGLLVTIFIPLLVLALMPRVKPRRALPLILTYLPPLLPLLIWWDGFASTLRTYTAEELRALAAEIAEPGYSWQVTEVSVPGAPIPVLCMTGTPR